ncbi:uncharacterized protein LAJ45_11729 [Morchella importuna]|uniref:uncharacterized protein n=1 Tax=Morchella importuna TaxID=1174673 RepID=UPI001E8D6ACA|nr:uncharacterized protein LAJ45_11729 [Morchella importuna]KAH8144296.1 hypothetical protein LAJ45_11729 [Morchella importuna]
MEAADGFSVDELNCADPSTHSSIKKDGYVNKSIASLKPCRSLQSDEEVKKTLSIIVKDRDGVIEVKYEIPLSLDANRNEAGFYLGRLCRVYTTEIFALDPQSLRSSPAGMSYYIKVLKADHLDSLKMITRFLGHQSAIGPTIQGVMVLVCIKAIYYRRILSTIDGRSLNKVEVVVFDDTSDSRLTMCGAISCSARTWILLITSAHIEGWEDKYHLIVNQATTIDVNPAAEATARLRAYAQLLKPPTFISPQFPVNQVFDWERELNSTNNVRLLYRFREINNFAKSRPQDQCIGYISVIIGEINLVSIKQCLPISDARHADLLYICETPVFTNELQVECIRCNGGVRNLLPNRDIIGLITDETGCLSGNKAIFSHRSWGSFFGCSVEALARGASIDNFRHFEQRNLFTRLTMVFGLDRKIEVISIWDIQR